jgi:acetyl-CoA C-acetyltransferase
MPFVAPVGTRLRCGGSSQRVTGCLAGSKLHVRPYLHESSATEEHLAMPAVKNYRHKADNPAAQQRCEITMEQDLNAPTVVTPFRLYDCTPQNDGATALVLATEVVADPFADQPSDVDVAEAHDFRTGTELMSYEDLGFAERLDGYGFLEAVNQGDGARIALAHDFGRRSAVSAATIIDGPGGPH